MRSTLPTHQSLALKKKIPHRPADSRDAGTLRDLDWGSAIFHEICFDPGTHLKYIATSAFLLSFRVCVEGGVKVVFLLF